MMPVIALLLAALGAAHPNDGPDLDLRIRVEDDRVVCQVVMNLVFCDEIVKVDRDVGEDLAPHEEELMRDALFAYYSKENALEVDGVAITPRLTAFDVPEPDLRLIPLLPRFGMKALFKIRLELTYPVDARPERVRLKWGPFPPDYALGFGGEIPPMQIPALFLAEGEEQLVLIFHDEPEYTWHRPKETKERMLPVPEAGRLVETIEVPVVSAALLGLLLLGGMFVARRPSLRRSYGVAVIAGLVLAATCWPLARVAIETGEKPVDLSEAEAVEIFLPLHRNIYSAFDYAKDTEIYDALEKSVHGDLLEELYDEVYLSLVMQEEGGALSRVKDVDVIDVAVDHVGVMPGLDAPGFQVTAHWRVRGSVFHFGHSHERVNEYRAVYSVVRTEKGWRIAGNQTLEQRLVETSAPEPPGQTVEKGGGK